MKLLILFTFISFLFATPCQESKESWPTLAQGRVKPLLVHAKESIKFITGKSRFNGQSASEVFCQLLFNPSFETSSSLPLLVEHIEVKKMLGLAENESGLPAKSAIASKELIAARARQIKQTTALKKELEKVWSRIALYEAIINKEAMTVYQDGQWLKLSEVDAPESSFISSKENFISSEGDSYLLELTFERSHIFEIAMLFALIGIFATVLFKSYTPGLVLGLLVVLVELMGMIMRIMISGRAPITNMYETVMFSGLGALVIGLILFIFKRDKVFILAGLGYNILCLFMMRFAGNMLDPSISPLVPVLRDNFWLSTHVTTIILSYAALALSWMLANIILFKNFRGTLSVKDYRYYEGLTHLAVKVGVVLLSAGIILGGVWADYSWGRFWGWDPKETWSLIVLLFYIALLHGKYTNWISTHRFVLATAGGFMSVMMAWFGVNYILATGLHSYGFSEGGAIFLGSFFLIQTLLLVIFGFKFKQRVTPA